MSSWADNETEAGADPPDRSPGPSTGSSPGSSASRLEVTGTQVCASALASVSGAAVASVFGVADTIVGAALVSVVATIGSAVYSVWIRRTHERLQQTPVTKIVDLVSRTSPGNTGAAGAPRIGARIGDGDGSAAADADDGARPSRSPSLSRPGEPQTGPDGGAPGWISALKGTLSQRRWGVVTGVAVVFAASLALITLIEVVGQQPLSGIAGDERSGGTSIGNLVSGDDSGSSSDDGTTTTTTTTSTDTSTPGGAGAEEDPSEDPSTDSRDSGEDSDSEGDGTTSTTSSSSTTTGSSSTSSTTSATPSTSATPETAP